MGFWKLFWIGLASGGHEQEGWSCGRVVAGGFFKDKLEENGFVFLLPLPMSPQDNHCLPPPLYGCEIDLLRSLSAFTPLLYSLLKRKLHGLSWRKVPPPRALLPKSLGDTILTREINSHLFSKQLHVFL